MDVLHTTAPMTITLRAAAALPGAGAWDAVPLEIQAFNCEWLTLYLAYARGGVAGGFDYQVQASPRLIDDATLEDWFPISLTAAGILAAGVDVHSRLQREYITYVATAGAVETALFGPVHVARNVARVRVVCRESGNVGAPGTLHILGALGY